MKNQNQKYTVTLSGTDSLENISDFLVEVQHNIFDMRDNSKATTFTTKNYTISLTIAPWIEEAPGAVDSAKTESNLHPHFDFVNQFCQPGKPNISLPKPIQQAIDRRFPANDTGTNVVHAEELRPGGDPVAYKVRGILIRKKQGTDCTEEESSIVMGYIKNNFVQIGSGQSQILEDIAELLPLEFGEAVDQMEGPAAEYYRHPMQDAWFNTEGLE